MTSPVAPETGEQYMQIARRWFTEGWAGNLAMADDIFGEELRTNGVHVGAGGPVGRIRGARARRRGCARHGGGAEVLGEPARPGPGLPRLLHRPVSRAG
jgi:hypothetical protein